MEMWLITDEEILITSLVGPENLVMLGPARLRVS